jgi:hypothetical protein
MNKKHERTDLKVADVPNVPTTTSLGAWWKRFSTLERDADEIHAVWSRLCGIRYDLAERQPGDEPPDMPPELSDHIKAILPRARAALQQIDADDHYDTDGERGRLLKKRIIAERLALMLGALPLGGPKVDADVFAKMLLEHVHVAEPSYLALESACRQIEAKQKFCATISEVLERISECGTKWLKRRFAIDNIENLSAQLRAEFAAARPKFELECATANVQQAEREYNQTRFYVVKNQNAAREAYQAVEVTMRELVECQQRLSAARAGLAAAVDALPRSGESDA